MALDKAATWAGQGKVIELEAIEETVAPTRVEKIFALTDAIGRRDLPEATRLVHNALDGGSHGLMVLTMIARQLRHLIKITSLPSSVRSNQEIAKAVGIMPFVVDNLQRQARQYGPGELEKPSSVAVDIGSRRIYVADPPRGRILVYRYGGN